MSGLYWRSPSPVDPVPARVVWWVSLRFRMSIVMAATSFLIVTVFGYYAAYSTAVSALERLRSEAITDLSASVATYSFTRTLPPSVFLDSKDLPSGLNVAAHSGAVVSYYDGHSIWAVQTVNGHLLSLSVSDQKMRDELDELLHAFLWGAVVLILVACVIGWLASGELTRRLRAAAQATREIGDGDFSRRIDVSGRDEVATMSYAVEQMASSLALLIERERAQTADAAHELRTPLTALVSSAQMLQDSREATLVRSQVKRLRTLIEEMLELARLTSPEENATLGVFDLSAVAARIVGNLPVDKDCEFLVLSSVPVLLEERRLERVLANLVINSYRHGKGPVTVTVEDSRVTVRDHGGGYPAKLLQDGPRRFGSSGQHAGSGLGLVIASHYAKSMSAILTLENASPLGAISTIELQPADSCGAKSRSKTTKG